MHSRLSFSALFIIAFVSLSQAQVSPAGRWLTAHTPHFRIHYRPGADSLALTAAGHAERAYAALSRELVAPRQRIDMVLSDAADYPNGSAGVAPSSRITILTTPPASEPELRNYDDWLQLLITHELAHIFHLDRVRGPWAVFQSLLGRVPGTFPNSYQPSWVAEGLATYYESRLTGRGRVNGSFHTQILAAAARGDRWLTAGEATYISPRWPHGIAAYAYGSRFFAQVARSAGDSAIPRFIERTAGQWIPVRTGKPLRAISGIDRDSAWRAMESEYERGAGDDRAEVVASKLRSPPDAAVSPSGMLAWFESRADEPAAIVVRQPDGGTERYRSTGGVDLAWAGDTLYATWLNLSDPVTYRSDLHRLVDGDWEQLTHNARLTDIAAGAGGVVAVRIESGGNQLVRLSGDSAVPLPGTDRGTTWSTPTEHPGGWITAVRHDSAGLRLVDIMSSEETVVVAGEGNRMVTDPEWSPDGSLLFYASDESGLPQIHTRSSSGATTRLTNEPAGATQAASAADGWLYYSSLDADGYVLKRIRWDTGRTLDAAAPTPVTRDPRVPAAMDSVPVRFTGYSPWSALRPHYFIPLVIDKGSAGVFIGAFTSGHDPVGRLAYGTHLGVGTDGARVDGTLSIFYQRWAHHGLDLFLSQDWGDAGLFITPTSTFEVRSRERDVELGVSNLWTGWYRSLTLRLAGHYEEDHFESSPALAFISPEFAGSSVTLGMGTFERPALAISNEDGVTVSVRYRRRWRLDTSGGSEDWRGRVALYQAIKGIRLYAHPVLAGRVGVATSSGPDEETYGIGGISGIGYQPLPGVFAGSSRLFPVRGFEAGEAKGGTAMVATAELRLPFLLVAKPLGGLPYGLDRLSLAFFYDYGRAWRVPRTDLPRELSSAGVELIWDLSVLYDVPLRLRTGLAVPLQDGSRTQRGKVGITMAFGSDF